MSLVPKSCDVVVFGDLFIDLVMTGFPRLPGLGEEAVASSMQREMGGGAAITACGLGVFGARTRVIGVVGAEETVWFRRKFAAKGVDAQALVTHPTEPTAITVAVSTVSDRVFYTYAAANALLAQLLGNPDTRVQLAQARHVHFAHLMEPELLRDLTQWLHAQHCTVSIDVGWDEAWLTNPASLEALAGVDWFFPNEREAALITSVPVITKADVRRTLQWFVEHGLSRVVLKLGSEGSAALQGNDIVLAPPVRSIVAVDTTGAGDCFDAGFLTAWLEGKDLQQCLAWGNVCGAFSTRCAGGIEGFPSRAEVETELKRV